MIMGSKHCFGAYRIVDIIGQCPCNGQTVIGTGATTYLVQNNQAVFGSIVYNIGHFIHFYHKGTLPGTQIITGTDTGKYTVYHRQDCFSGRYERADLHQNGCHRHTTAVGTFPCHIWPGDNEEPFIVRMKIYIIRDKPAVFQFVFYYRMTTFFQTILPVF